MKSLSSKFKNFPKSGIRRMFELAKDYPDAINLCIGEPNFDTPENIRISAKKAIDDGMTHYSPNYGIDELRKSIVDKYRNEYGLEVEIDNVMVAFGGMQALAFSLMAIIDPGDEIIVSDPCYPNYLSQITLFGGVPVKVPVYEENGFRVQAKDIEEYVTANTKAIIINSPCNPTGAVLTQEDLESIGQLAVKHDLYIISDEVYEKILFDGSHHFSIAQIPSMRERVMIINSFSKTYAMTGWRIGYVVASKEIISLMPGLQESIASCVTTFVQAAAVEAMNGSQDDLQNMLGDYSRRRDILVGGLNKIPGISCYNPPGTFYAFVNVKDLGKKSEQLAVELVKEAGVVAVPGSAFGEFGEGYLRFAFANSDENLKNAVKRIENHVRRNYTGNVV